MKVLKCDHYYLEIEVTLHLIGCRHLSQRTFDWQKHEGILEKVFCLLKRCWPCLLERLGKENEYLVNIIITSCFVSITLLNKDLTNMSWFWQFTWHNYSGWKTWLWKKTSKPSSVTRKSGFLKCTSWFCYQGLKD